jgi:hypothetical protein
VNAPDPKPPISEPTTVENVTGYHKTQVPQITLITKRDAPALMSKRISLDGEGKLKSDGSDCRMTTARLPANVRELQTRLRGSSLTAVPIRPSLLGH